MWGSKLSKTLILAQLLDSVLMFTKLQLRSRNFWITSSAEDTKQSGSLCIFQTFATLNSLFGTQLLDFFERR